VLLSVGAFIHAKTKCFSPRCEVHFGEAISLLYALSWVHKLNLGPINFELDSKKVVDIFLSSRPNGTKFRDIIKNCKLCIFNFYNESSIEFIWIQVNEVVHNFAKMTLFLTSSQMLIDILHCMKHILINKLLQAIQITQNKQTTDN
jgi:hypothetical protein